MTTRTYFLPQSLDEAVALLAEHGPELLIKAGGTIIMPMINEGVIMPEKVMGLKYAGCNYIQRTNGKLQIGATTTLTQMVLQKELPILAEAAHHIGAWAIRNMATVGGNIMAPAPIGDFAVALLALDAQVHLKGNKGKRVMPLDQFYTGFMTNALLPGELLCEIEIPVPEARTVYLKYGRRHANAQAVVSVAAYLELVNHQVKAARLALNAVGPHPFRATEAEKALTGARLDANSIAAAADIAAQECDPCTDAISSAWYRRKMVVVYVRRALSQLAGQEASL